MRIYFQLLSLLLFVQNGLSQTTNNDSLARRHQQMMDIIMTKPKLPVKHIGIFLYNGYQTLDAMGPYETLGQLSGVKIFFIAKEKGFISNQRGMKIQVDTSIDKVNKLDILVIPGGAAETFLTSLDTTVLNWIRKIDQTTIYTTSVCTGAWILGATGLLNGKTATTNWYRAAEMLQHYGAQFKDSRWVQDGKYWTSAGVTAGIDMSLAIINELMGEKYTQGVMLNMEYDPHPPVEGGSVSRSPAIVKDMMEQMYDMGLQPLFKKYLKK
ncbi:MAG: DJ-1/PfpI family protein [Bacteroidetes bacterium]|nr:DJ-1/PfpI family protein [Bacteroidota bacterium]